MEDLNKLEKALVMSVLEANKEKYPFLSLHLPEIRVRDREFSDVGQFTNFEYEREVETIDVEDILSSKQRLIIQELENELSYVLSISGGKIQFLEIVTNGNDHWNGAFDRFMLS